MMLYKYLRLLAGFMALSFGEDLVEKCNYDSELFFQSSINKFRCSEIKRSMKDSLQEWIKSYEKDIGASYDKPSSISALDKKNPKIDVSIPMLKGRKKFRKLKIDILTSSNISLFKGIMKNGHLLTHVDQKKACHIGWSKRIKIITLAW